jgi:hypothetical protein
MVAGGLHRWHLYAYVGGNPTTFIDSLGLVPGDPFATPGQAAADVLAYINPVSIAVNLEYGGVIRLNAQTGEYYADYPTAGTPTGWTADTDFTADVIGVYHTHGNYSIESPDTGLPIPTSDPLLDEYNSDQFSTHDIEAINAWSVGVPGFTGYLGTPSGNFLQYTPGMGPPSVLPQSCPK